MSIDNLIQIKKNQLKGQKFIEFSDEELDSIAPDQIDEIIEKLHGSCLMRLPETEIAFFEWLYREEPGVWADLWPEKENDYLVSVNFLKSLLNRTSGFQICDLEHEDNYWFCRKHLKPKALELVPDILEKIEIKQKVKLHEAFIVFIQHSPIDIWHFAFKYKTSIRNLKLLISELEYQGLLVHLKKSEDLIRYIE